MSIFSTILMITGAGAIVFAIYRLIWYWYLSLEDKDTESEFVLILVVIFGILCCFSLPITLGMNYINGLYEERICHKYKLKLERFRLISILDNWSDYKRRREIGIDSECKTWDYETWKEHELKKIFNDVNL